MTYINLIKLFLYNQSIGSAEKLLKFPPQMLTFCIPWENKNVSLRKNLITFRERKRGCRYCDGNNRTQDLFTFRSDRSEILKLVISLLGNNRRKHTGGRGREEHQDVRAVEEITF